MIIDELYKISDLITSGSELERNTMKLVRKWFKELETTLKLQKYVSCINWGDVPYSYAKQFANEVDEPFLKLLKTIQINKLSHNIHSLIRMWQRLKGLNKQYIITYCRLQDLLAYATETIMGEDIIAVSYKGADGLKAFMDYYNDDKNVERTLRELLEISATTEIKPAFIKWAQKNHPDKGGNHNVYVAMSSCYEEWQRTQQKECCDDMP